jgi:hypothetical protein
MGCSPRNVDRWEGGSLNLKNIHLKADFFQRSIIKIEISSNRIKILSQIIISHLQVLTINDFQHKNDFPKKIIAFFIIILIDI